MDNFCLVVALGYPMPQTRIQYLFPFTTENPRKKKLEKKNGQIMEHLQWANSIITTDPRVTLILRIKGSGIFLLFTTFLFIERF